MKGTDRKNTLKASATVAGNAIRLLPLLQKHLLKLDDVQRRHHIPYSHLQILFLLDSCGPLPVSEIAKRLSIAKTNTTPLLDRLCMSDYIARSRSPKDRRVIIMSLQPKGKEFVDMLLGEIADHLDSRIASLRPGQRREFLSSMESLLLILERI